MTTRILAALLAALLLAAAPAVSAKEYLVTGAKPNKLVVIDAAARQVTKIHEIPGGGIAPGTIVPSPDGKVAYVVTNHLNSVSGIDLQTGEQVFRADFSTPDHRVKAMFAMDVSPDGKELFVFQSPVRILPGEYKVEDTRIAVFRTADGVGAKPVRTMKAPRRIAVLAFSRDGGTLWALGWDLYAMDPKTGAVRQTHKVLNWTRKNYNPPDILDVWPQFEQAAVFSTPYFTSRKDLPPTDPSAARTGMLTLDLASGKVAMKDFEDTSAVIFSSVVNPQKKGEVFSVYTQLSKIDATAGKLVKRIDLPHTYYAINISGDGKEVYVGGTTCDVGVYSTDTLEKLGGIQIEGCPDQGVASLRTVRW
ncbi:quinohemoprotein amine dehydrogenase subunit beta [Azospirillum thermophilum]|uniref:Quinohemoprotein amine dehydrogenase subunit beta n=1 Tax=Azospirillum thermophilum TaxID=2202148 RepID=A0A2S2CKC2_9PROT|nr:quinohemoprotein amine dehydrogenase subunit beta [Azospirillum thermophilum]AWK84879.1 quinohemoprotein amine dehydrogenase subunit beta [Azospirillum thermophilum]